MPSSNKQSRDFHNATSRNINTNKRIFKKRPGTTDIGKDYEDLMIANLTLQLLKDTNIEDFFLWSNDEQFGAFDDVIVEVKSKDKPTEKYALQLKHISQKSKKLSLSSLTEESGNFAINKYFESYQTIKDSISNFRVVLFTNLKFSLDKTVQLQIKIDGKTVQVEIIKCSADTKLNTSKDSAECYKFKIVDDVAPSELNHFFGRFFLYTNQMSVDEVKTRVCTQLQTMFSCKNTVSEKYLKFISQWSIREGVKNKLDKELMEQIIALYLVGPFIQSLCFSDTDASENQKLLQRVVLNFHVTRFRKEWVGDVKRLFSDAKRGVSTENLDKVNQNFQITNLEQLTDDNFTILLWLMNKCPLIVQENPEFDQVVKLCPRKSFILIGDDVLEESRGKIFQKLSDLNYDDYILDSIITNFKCLLSGEEISLSNLLQADASFRDVISTNELLRMTQGPYEVKQTEEEIPTPYISRFLSRNLFFLTYLHAVDDSTLIFISSATSEQDTNLLKKYRPIFVDDYQDEDKLLHFEQFFSRRNIYVSTKICSQREFYSICERNSMMKTFHHFRIFDGMLEWVQSRSNNIEDLEQQRIRREHSASELELSDFGNFVNIISGESGMGKSCLFRNLKNRMSFKTWTVIFSVRDITNICDNYRGKKFCDDLEDFLIQLKFSKYDRFDQHVIKFMLQNQQVVFLWDGLDELVSDDNMAIITNVVKKFSEKNVVQWLSCRNHLKNALERTFNVLARTLLPYSEEQQIYYIQDRLKFVDIDENHLEDLISNLKDNPGRTLSNDILRNPLQIYMLTELCRRDTKKYTKLLSQTFLLTDLYQHFIEEKLVFFYSDKVKLNDSQINQLKQVIRSHFRQLEIVALKVLFEPEFLQKLNIDWEFEDDSDSFGFTTSHISYAEYFVATYFSKRKVPYLKEVIFHEKYTNVRYFFDMLLAKSSPVHIAVLHTSISQLKMCPEDIQKKDLGGRNVLQLASSWGRRYPLLNFKKESDAFVLNEKEPSVKAEAEEYLQILEHLTEGVDADQTDDIFNMNAMKYAESANCLFPLAVLEEKRKSGYFQTKSDNFNCTCLYYFTKFGHLKYITQFQSYLNFVRTSKGETLLHIACENRHQHVVSFLIQFGLDVNSCDLDAQTCLYPAARLGDVTIVKLLLTNGAKANIYNTEKWTPLFVASYNGHHQVVELLIDGSDLNASDKYEWTPLHSASFSGYEKICDTLVKHGADLNVTEKYGWTPLHTASYSGHPNIVKLLLKNGAEINARDKYGWTLFYPHRNYQNDASYLELLSDNKTSFYSTIYNLHDRVLEFLHGLNFTTSEKTGWTSLFVAAHNSHDEVVDLLAKSGADLDVCDSDGRTALYSACENGCESVVQLLVKHGANINASDKKGHTQLHTASATDTRKVVDLLIKYGADINAPDGLGCTPLHLAAEFGRAEVVQRLILSNVDVNASDKNGFTPLHTAAYQGHTKVVDFLIQSGADLNRSGKNGQTPLYSASRHGHEGVIKLLVKFGADVNVRDVDGRTALHSACYSGHIRAVEILTVSGADINASTGDGWTPLYIASGKGDDGIVERLVKLGAQIDVFSKSGLMPLHLACKRGHGRVVELLIKSGADINALSKDGQTALDFASSQGHFSVVEILVKHTTARTPFTVDECI
ncbi:hypothetical protein Zmor_018434 [Zophobas morio]|uniref:NACHT domain-containing protein n=1 Tax=Zophobas morio TaxID=2755281 RepID=A0AA38IBH0_9CUCU|nr:hypothetical protein Zmor_018434 [Zophobas morio]